MDTVMQVVGFLLVVVVWGGFFALVWFVIKQLREWRALDREDVKAETESR